MLNIGTLLSVVSALLSVGCKAFIAETLKLGKRCFNKFCLGLLNLRRKWSNTRILFSALVGSFSFLLSSFFPSFPSFLLSSYPYSEDVVSRRKFEMPWRFDDCENLKCTSVSFTVVACSLQLLETTLTVSWNPRFSLRILLSEMPPKPLRWVLENHRQRLPIWKSNVHSLSVEIMISVLLLSISLHFRSQNKVCHEQQKEHVQISAVKFQSRKPNRRIAIVHTCMAPLVRYICQASESREPHHEKEHVEISRPAKFHSCIPNAPATEYVQKINVSDSLKFLGIVWQRSFFPVKVLNFTFLYYFVAAGVPEAE